MGRVNIVVQRGTGRIFNVDYETMRPGHRGVDCGYFLSALSKWGDPPPSVDFIRRLVLDAEYLGSAEAARFSTVYMDVLTEIGRAIHERARALQQPAAKSSRVRNQSTTLSSCHR